MKYYLFIGYQLFEKNIKYPSVKIYNDNTLIDEFVCDNESSASIESVYDEKVEEIVINGKRSVNHKSIRTFTTPNKVKVYEIDSSSWHEESVIKIQVINNKSNYNNGFMNKRSMVLIDPVFLMPRSLYEDKDTVEKIFLKTSKLKGKVPGIQKIAHRPRIIWPGHCNHSDTENEIENSANHQYFFSGGDFEQTLNIRRKHGIYFATQKEKNPIGFFHVDDFTHAWYQWMHNYRFNFLGTSFCTGGMANKDIKLIKTKINTENEDQRSNHT